MQELHAAEPGRALLRDLLRSRVRRAVPLEARRRVRIAQRATRDRMRKLRFARRVRSFETFPFSFASYYLPFVDYPNQEAIASAKRENQRLMAARLRVVRIRPGEVFSLWRLAGRPRAGEGYAPAAAVINGKLTVDVGGATCMLSTVVYNTALLGGMTILERHPHAVDTYGEARYFEPGRDAAIEYGYKDLRFRNDHEFTVVLVVDADGNHGVSSELRLPAPAPFRVSLEVGAREDLQVRDALFGRTSAFRHETLRRIRYSDGREIVESLGRSQYLIPDERHRAP